MVALDHYKRKESKPLPSRKKKRKKGKERRVGTTLSRKKRRKATPRRTGKEVHQFVSSVGDIGTQDKATEKEEEEDIGNTWRKRSRPTGGN